jgi:hypothetical protein
LKKYGDLFDVSQENRFDSEEAFFEKKLSDKIRKWQKK